MRSAHKWQFAPRFRRHAFGWRSDTPIQRIKEALSEIKQVARKEPLLAAEGAVTLLEKLSRERGRVRVVFNVLQKAKRRAEREGSKQLRATHLRAVLETTSLAALVKDEE